MQTLSSRNRAFLTIATILAIVPQSTALAQAVQTARTAAPTPATAALPERLSDAEFWRLMSDISEPGGYFRMADNFVSNERDIGAIASMIRDNGPTGGVYLGVGPEQNLTYIAAVRPKMVFIVDIRRQAVIHHLLYKTVFELSKDRADFISQLFAKPRPTGLDTASTIIQVWDAFNVVPMDTAMFARNLTRFRDHLTKTHGFALTSDELSAFDHVYNSFVNYGPNITTSGPPSGASARGSGPPPVSTTTVRVTDSATAALAQAIARLNVNGRGPPNFVSLTSVTDANGKFNSFLGNEDSFRFIKDLHMKNLFVPNSGNFGGPRAIRAVGAYVKERGAIVTAFYVSNVESYLFGDQIATTFYENVATLPVDETSVFIRPGGLTRGVALCPIAGFLRAVAAGLVFNNGAATSCGR